MIVEPPPSRGDVRLVAREGTVLPQSCSGFRHRRPHLAPVYGWHRRSGAGTLEVFAYSLLDSQDGPGTGGIQCSVFIRVRCSAICLSRPKSSPQPTEGRRYRIGGQILVVSPCTLSTPLPSWWWCYYERVLFQGPIAHCAVSVSVPYARLCCLGSLRVEKRPELINFKFKHFRRFAMSWAHYFGVFFRFIFSFSFFFSFRA